MNFNIETINDGDILVREFKGDVLFSEIYDSWITLIENNSLIDIKKGVLNDFRNATLHVNLDDLKDLMALFSEHKPIFSRLKLAVIMEKPENFVLPIYAETNYPDFKIKAFCTREAAINWLNKY